MSDTNTEHKTGVLTPDSITEHTAGRTCKDCKKEACWSVELVNGQGSRFAVKSCDDHVQRYWGYHPEERQ